MKTLTKDYRIQADSIGDIRDAFDASAKRIAREVGLTFGKRSLKIRAGPLMNALVLAFVDMSPDRQNDMAVSAVGRLEQYLAETAEEKLEASVRTGHAEKNLASRLGSPQVEDPNEAKTKPKSKPKSPAPTRGSKNRA
jgi:hypothetical protein